MANFLPPSLLFSPPPPWWAYPPPPPRPWRPPPSTTDNSSTSPGGIIGGFFGILFAAIILVVLCRKCSVAAQPPAAPVPEPPGNDDEQQSRSACEGEDGRPRHASPTEGLPSFTYSQSVKYNVTGSGDEAATCSVCLGALEIGETVRLLPVCLHLYHVECIDPWLAKRSTCPVCRSGTDVPLERGQLPPV